MPMKLKNKLVCLLVCCAIALPLGGCGESKAVEKQIFSMDTVMLLKAYGAKAEAGLTDAVAIINSLDKALDPELSTSTVYALNNAAGEEVVVSGQIAEMLETAKTVYDRSEGALDLAIYPVVKLWGFVDGQYRVPKEADITELLETIDFSKLDMSSFLDSDSVLVKMPAGMELSFGAIAKGCASEYAISALRQAGVESAIVSLGGNVQTLGKKPDGSNWNIVVQDPKDTGSYLGSLSVGETAVVTSGGYYRYFEADDGTIYHHIIDPATGYPSDNGLVSATVICNNGTLADALSTAVYVLGADKALEYYHTWGGFEMVLVTEDDRILVTNGLYDVFTLQSDGYTVEYIS